MVQISKELTDAEFARFKKACDYLDLYAEYFNDVERICGVEAIEYYISLVKKKIDKLSQKATTEEDKKIMKHVYKEFLAITEKYKQPF